MSTPLSQSLPRFNQQRENAKLEAEDFRLDNLTADDAEGAGNTIPDGAIRVAVIAVTNDANDFIVLPSIADVPVGHEITIVCNAGSNFELRTPASSGELINGLDSDGTNEYHCLDENVVRIIKITDADGWRAASFSPVIPKQEVTADDADTAGLNMISPNARLVEVVGVTNDANDWITLPPLASVPDGTEITILQNAGGNCELRTPATSGELINTEDADGTTEALATDATIIKATKQTTADGWRVYEIQATGAIAAINPDA